MHPAVFLDRDDTLIEANSLPPPPPPAAPGDLVDPALVRLLPGVHTACMRLHAARFKLVIISNQGVVARGGLTIAGVERVNDAVRGLLPGLIDAVYFCPYHPRGTVEPYAREHPWRKPGPGMILAARDELDLDLARSWLVGDAARDIEAGIAAGIAAERCLRIGPGQQLPDLLRATDRILATTQDPGGAPGLTDSRS